MATTPPPAPLAGRIQTVLDSASPHDPSNAPDRLLRWTCGQMNRLRAEAAFKQDNHQLTRQAKADLETVYAPDADPSFVAGATLVLVQRTPESGFECGLTVAEHTTLKTLLQKVQAEAQKQYKQSSRGETRKIYDTLQLAG